MISIVTQGLAHKPSRSEVLEALRQFLFTKSAVFGPTARLLPFIARYCEENDLAYNLEARPNIGYLLILTRLDTMKASKMTDLRLQLEHWIKELPA